MYLGRAKLNILRAQFGKCRDDCKNALKIKLDAQVYFILARSLFFVDKLEECQKTIEEALTKFAQQDKMEQLQKLVEAKLRIERQRLEQVKMINQGKEDEKMKVYRNLIGKGVKLGKAMHDLPASVDGSITVDKKGKLHFPVLVLYEEFMVTDFVQDWTEDATFKDELRPLFKDKAPWDHEGVYRMDTIEVYFEADMCKPLNKKDVAKHKSTKKHI